MSNEGPVVSALIRTKDRPEFLELSLRSVVTQTFEDLEVIVVEDGGQPHAGDVTGQIGDDRVRVVRSAESLGVGAASRIAIENARGRHVAFLDDDDLWEPRFLESLVAPLESDASVVAAFCRRRLIDESGREIHPGDPRYHEDLLHWPGARGRLQPFVREALVSPVVNVAQSAVLRRTALDWSHLGPVMSSAWDGLTCHAACRGGGAAWYEPAKLSSYRIHDSSMNSMGGRTLLDDRVDIARLYHDDEALRPWRRDLAGVLSDALMTRALAFSDASDLRRSRRDLTEALRVRATWRAVRAAPFLAMPYPLARAATLLVRLARSPRPTGIGP